MSHLTRKQFEIVFRVTGRTIFNWKKQGMPFKLKKIKGDHQTSSRKQLFFDLDYCTKWAYDHGKISRSECDTLPLTYASRLATHDISAKKK